MTHTHIHRNMDIPYFYINSPPSPLTPPPSPIPIFVSTFDLLCPGNNTRYCDHIPKLIITNIAKYVWQPFTGVEPSKVRRVRYKAEVIKRKTDITRSRRETKSDGTSWGVTLICGGGSKFGYIVQGGATQHRPMGRNNMTISATEWDGIGCQGGGWAKH